jgi:hypothetical protein
VRISDELLTPDEFLFIAAEAPVEDADFDNDGDVDGEDFLTWQRGITPTGNTSATNDTGDADDDGDVDANDLEIWRTEFGTPQISAVPEPASGGITALALLGLTAFARRRETIAGSYAGTRVEKSSSFCCYSEDFTSGRESS